MWFTLPLDVIWKHQMGERHWTWGRLIAHTFFCKISLFIIGSIMIYNKPPPPLPQTFKDYIPFITIEGFILIMWIFGVANLIEIHNRRKRGIVWHSYYWGTPRFLPDRPIVHCLAIPLGSTLIATVCLWLFSPLAVYLYILAGLQMLDATDTYHKRRIEKLDRSDREISLEIKTNEYENDHRPKLEIVRIAKPPVRTAANQESDFNERWQKVLKPLGSEKNP